jgi:hypothetical protein
MKKRIGVIAEVKEKFENYKSCFPDAHFHFGKNVIEFFQIIGSQKPDLVIFLDTPEVIKSVKFLRGKAAFATTPFLILFSEDNFSIPTPHRDAYLRSYQLNADLFMNILDFLGQLENPKSLETPFTLDRQKLENDFIGAIKKKMGQSENFTVRIATDDELHARFYCQQAAEVSTHLFWVKYNARILEEGNPAFEMMLKNFSDEEKEQISNQMLSLVMQDFQNEMMKPVIKSGAVPFPPTDRLEFEDRKAFVKTAKNTALIFESASCRWILEMTQYI